MEFFLWFLEAHIDMVIGKRLFDTLRTFQVKRMEKTQHMIYVCCCIYHVEMEILCVGFHNMCYNEDIHSETQCECACNELCCPNDIDSPFCVDTCYLSRLDYIMGVYILPTRTLQVVAC